MPTDIGQVRARIRGYILENLLFTDDPSQLPDDASLLDRGIIDSTGVLELVSFVEGEYGLSVADEEIIPANFDSVDALAAFVARRKG